jgi:lipopolysaccharide export system permease protein
LVFPATLNRYIFREIVIAFFFCFSVFLAAGLIAGFLPLLQKGMEVGMDLTLILFQVLIHALPGTLVTVLPLSIMIGILLGLGRMASDNEIAAIKASGISIIRLLPPVVLLGILGVVFSLVCTLFLIPKGIAKGRMLMQEAMMKKAHAGIEERTFFDALKDLILYVEKIDSGTGEMSRIFIRESSQPNEITTILANRGTVQTDQESRSLVLHLHDGTIVKENQQGDSSGVLEFKSYVFRYTLDPAKLGHATRSFEEMSISEMREKVVQTTLIKPEDPPDVITYHNRVRLFADILIFQRLVYPFSCLALAMAAFPLGVVNMGKSRLNNVSAGLLGMFVYYSLVLATDRAARSGLASPLAVLPIPPVAFIGASLYFILCLNQEKLPRFLVGIPSLFRYGKPVKVAGKPSPTS